MIIEDNTLNKTFSELKEGTCFVTYSQYYMKLYIKYNDNIAYKSYAVNLKTGIAETIEADEKVRVVSGKMIIE